MPDAPHLLGISRTWHAGAQQAPSERIAADYPLYRIMSFTGDSIDDIVNSPIAKNRVRAYYRVYRQVQRTCEIIDLERWWNPPVRCANRKVV